MERLHAVVPRRVLAIRERVALHLRIVLAVRTDGGDVLAAGPLTESGANRVAGRATRRLERHRARRMWRQRAGRADVAEDVGAAVAVAIVQVADVPTALDRAGI